MQITIHLPTYAFTHAIPLPIIVVVGRRRLSAVSVRGHHDQMIQEDAPRVQTHTEAVNARLLERILVEQIQELQHRKERVKLHPLQVRRHKPVEEVGAFGEESNGVNVRKGRDKINRRLAATCSTTRT